MSRQQVAATRESTGPSRVHSMVATRQGDSPHAMQLQARYGTFPPGIVIGRTDDPAEREADRTAAALVGPVRAMPMASPGAPMLPGQGSLMTTPGIGLPTPTRRQFEARLGTDLSAIRLHRTTEAASMADRLDATAFSHGRDIALGADAPPLHAAEGQRLLAHEVAHIALGHDGVRRQPRPGRAALPAVAQRPTAPHAEQDLARLTNAAFLGEMDSARAASASPAHRQAVEAERQRRVALGHQWLTTDLREAPTLFYRLTPAGAARTAVIEVGPAIALGPATDSSGAPILSADQFRRHLAEEGIPTVPASALASGTAAGPKPRLIELPTVGAPGGGKAPYVVVNPLTSPSGLRTVEVRFEKPARLLPDFGRSASLPADFPPALVEKLPGSQFTVEELALLLRSGPNAQENLRGLIAFSQGVPAGLGSDIYESTPGLVKYGFVVGDPNSRGVGRALTGERCLETLRSGVPKMHLVVGQSERPVTRSGANTNAVTAVEQFHGTIFEALGVPGVPSTGTQYELNQQEMAKVALAMRRGLDPAETAVLQRIAAGDVAAVKDLRALPPRPLNPQIAQAWAQSLGPGPRAQFRREVASPLTPEWAAAQRHGPVGAAGRATGLGIGAGALLGVGIDAAASAWTGDLSGFGDRAPRDALLGGIGGGVAMGVNQALVARTSNALIAQGIVPSAGSGLRLLGTRTIGGGAAAGVVELVMIFGFEDRPHSATEIVGRTARSTGIGLVSAGAGTLATAGTTSLIGAILATGGAGAAGGSVVPGWGTAVGFLVGLGVGVVTYVVLDHALPKVPRN